MWRELIENCLIEDVHEVAILLRDFYRATIFCELRSGDFRIIRSYTRFVRADSVNVYRTA
jgi:hypothetical protein